MDFTFSDQAKSPPTRVVILPTSNPKNVGLWKSSKGHKVYRTASPVDLKTFLSKVRGYTSLEVDRRVLTPSALQKGYWSLFAKYPLKVLVPSPTLENLLPPWLSSLVKILPKLEDVYPPGKTVYPPIEQVFSGLWFDPSSLRINILGQDPYIKAGQAHGLAFSFKGKSNLPPSLINIFKEIKRVDSEFTYSSGDLTPWFRQGVGLINSSFTVIEGLSDSLSAHWYDFSQALFKKLAQETTSNLVVMAWGKKAQTMAKFFTKAKVLQSSHPSGYSVNAPPYPFAGNNHFKLANDHLRSKGLSPIIWRL